MSHGGSSVFDGFCLTEMIDQVSNTEEQPEGRIHTSVVEIQLDGHGHASAAHKQPPKANPLRTPPREKHVCSSTKIFRPCYL